MNTDYDVTNDFEEYEQEIYQLLQNWNSELNTVILNNDYKSFDNNYNIINLSYERTQNTYFDTSIDSSSNNNVISDDSHRQEEIIWIPED